MASDLIIDGNNISSYDDFVREFNRGYLAISDGPPWNGDISDLHELLEAVEEAEGKRLTIRWANSQRSRSKLDHEQMAEFWAQSIAEIPDAFSPDGFQLVYGWQQDRLNQARARQGRTLFEYLVWQIRGDEGGVDDEGNEFTELLLE